MLENYVGQFSKLRTDKSSSRWSASTQYRAPHKPLLLLAVIDLFSQGAVESNLIELNPELGELFTLYWSRVMPIDRRGNIALPFFHLQSDGFWHLLPQPGNEDFLSSARQIRSVNQLQETVIGAQLDEELYALLCAEESRDILRTMLIETYFAPELQAELVEQSTINVEAFRYSQKLLKQARDTRVEEQVEDLEDYETAIRDQGFRRAVVIAYEHRCSFCGIRMVTPDGHTAVEAAHIVPWSVSQNDDPRNGMALCRLCHWTFDEGLTGVSSSYEVIASPQLTVGPNLPGHLVTLEGRNIIGPSEEILWPDLECLRWHRQEVFQRR